MIHGALWSLTSAIVSRGLTLLSSIIAARMLGAEAFGSFGIVQSTISFFGILGGFGLALTATKFVAETRSICKLRASEVISAVSVMTLIMSCLASIAVVLVSPSLAGLTGDPSLDDELRISSLLLFFASFNGSQVGILVGLEAFKTLAAAAVVRGVVTGVGLVLGIGSLGLAGGLWGLVFGEAIALTMYQIAIAKAARASDIPLVWRMPRTDDISLLRFSIPALIAGLLTMSATWISYVILTSQQNGLSQMGFVHAADRYALAILFIPSTVAGVVLPLMSSLKEEGDMRGYRDVFQTNLGLNLITGAVPAVFVIMAAKPLMTVYGSAFEDGWLVLVLLAAGTIPTALNNVMGQFLISTGAVWWRLCFDALLATTLLILSVVLIPRYGAVGFAASSTVAFAVAASGLAWYTLKNFPTSARIGENDA